jgi:hypothetical protein
VILVLAGLWALVGAVALIWLVASRRSRLTRQRRPEKAQSAARAVGDLDAEWIYGDRAERKPQARPREVNEETTNEAEAIVRDAELKARNIIAGAEGARREIVAELAREQADLAEKTSRLAEFLAGTLEEVERASANGSGAVSAHDLEQLEALQDELRGGE